MKSSRNYYQKHSYVQLRIRDGVHYFVSKTGNKGTCGEKYLAGGVGIEPTNDAGVIYVTVAYQF